MTSAILQIIALLTMTIDHIGYCLFPGVPWLRMVGRLSFPIFAFMLAEGFVNTSNRRKYSFRLALFAVISEIPYQLFSRHALGVSDPWSNIFFELLLMLIALMCLERGKLFCLGAAAAVILAELMGTMYGAYGILLAVCFYLFRDKRWVGLLYMAALTGGYCFCHGSLFQIYAIAAAIPLYFYNGQRGRRLPRYFGYIYYPAHLLVIYGIYCLQRAA